jgi:hypothetical protein
MLDPISSLKATRNPTSSYSSLLFGCRDDVLKGILEFALEMRAWRDGILCSELAKK